MKWTHKFTKPSTYKHKVSATSGIDTLHEKYKN